MADHPQTTGGIETRIFDPMRQRDEMDRIRLEPVIWIDEEDLEEIFPDTEEATSLEPADNLVEASEKPAEAEDEHNDD